MNHQQFPVTLVNIMKIFITICLLLLLTACASVSKSKLPEPKVILRLKPKALTAKSISVATTISKTLIWNYNDPSDNVSYYNIYEVIPKTPTVAAHWTIIGTSVTNGFVLNNLVIGSLHIYQVSAVATNQVESLKSSLLIVRIN